MLSAPADGSWRLDTGFGPVEVERVQRTAGGSHGHEVQPGERSDEVRLRVTVENGLGRPLPWSPGQLRLRHAGAGTTSPMDPRAGARVIEPGGKVRQELTFLVPRSSTRLALLVDDLMARRPLPLALGTVPGP